MKEDFLSLIKTKSEANIFFEFVDLLEDKTYGTETFNKSIVDKLAKEIVLKEEYEVAPPWLEEISSRISKNTKLESVRMLLDDLTHLVSGAELVKIEISFEPSRDFINDVYKIIEESGFGCFLLDLELNPKLRGGAKFFVGGKYYNLTLNAVVAKYLRTKDVIKRYL
jgi:hypothetical protein